MKNNEIIIEELKRETIDTFRRLRGSNNLIHCISHSINLNDMANVILALNQSPIMADHIDEMNDIVPKTNSLLVNLGNIKEYRIDTIIKACSLANINNIPIVLDLVGIGVSNLRLNLANSLLRENSFCIVKGNYSEIICLMNNTCKTRGVDNEEGNQGNVIVALTNLSREFDCTFIATGKEDLIFNKEVKVKVLNGTSKLTNITGTGCMAGAIMTSIVPLNSGLISGLCALSILGISGEVLEKEDLGFGSFHIRLLDEISKMTTETLKEYIKWELIQ